MKADLKNSVQKVKLEGKEYCFEYDFNAYSELEDETGCGVYQLYAGMTSNEGISLKKSLAILGCGMLKHHSAEEIQEILAKIKEYPGLWLKMKEYAVAAFLLPLLPPEILEKTRIKGTSKKREIEQETFSWVEDYTVARRVLGWSDSEFWAASPRKLCAVFYTYLDLQSKINSVSPAAQKPLVGADAIKSLSRIASSIR